MVSRSISFSAYEVHRLDRRPRFVMLSSYQSFGYTWHRLDAVEIYRKSLVFRAMVQAQPWDNIHFPVVMYLVLSKGLRLPYL